MLDIIYWLFYDEIMEESNFPSKKKHWLKTLMLLEVGIIEVLIVGVVTFIFFAVFNYFNILRLSDLYPKYLGWLPRQEKTQKPTVPPTQNTSKITSSPTLIPTEFQYDVKKAKILLNKYIKDTIRLDFLPPTIDIEQGLAIDGEIGNLPYEFGSQFSANNHSISVNFHYKENTNDPNDYIIFIPIKNINEVITIDPSLANSELRAYFNNPYDISLCSNKGKDSLCQSFKAETEGKRGYGLLFTYDGNKFTPILFTCFVPKTSDNYLELNSCIRGY